MDRSARITAPTPARFRAAAFAAALSACADAGTLEPDAGVSADARPSPAPACTPDGASFGHMLRAAPPPTRADDLVIYELQVRSANACDPEVGSVAQREACAGRPGPVGTYRAVDSTCPAAVLDPLLRVRLGTFDDLLADTVDFRDAISLRYVRERVGANAVWFMPVFPANDVRLLPDPCDNLGSPYAVTDYMHTSGALSRNCLGDDACTGDDAFARVIGQADALDLRVFVDVALNHFGHGYTPYEIAGARPVRDWGAVDPTDLDATFDEALVWPEVLDSRAALDTWASRDANAAAARDALFDRCPDLRTADDATVTAAFSLWWNAFDDERAAMDCGPPWTLDARLPAHFVASDLRPARSESRLTNDYGWRDVSFLYHRDDPAYVREALRVRELAFRILNRWAAAGVDGFRLDHTTDWLSGLSPATWREIKRKVAYYAARRGQPEPIWLAEEFHDPFGMAPSADILTEGYLFDMAARGRGRSTSDTEATLLRAQRFGEDARVLAALETHDELRVVTDTGLDPWTGLGVWALGAAVPSAPMLLAGQEFGESARLAFRRSHFMPARFDGTPEQRGDADALVDAHRAVAEARLQHPALHGGGMRLLRPPGGAAPVDGAVAVLRWSNSGHPIVAIHNLWWQDVQGHWAIPADVRAGVGIPACEQVRVRDVLTGAVVVGCREGRELERGFRLFLPSSRRMIWGAIELCEPG